MKKTTQHLTKSRFKIGCECPTKLSYLDNPAYQNNNIENSFLAALAEGGFQVGELAKTYVPGGVEVLTRDKAAAAAETAELLKKPEAVVYEAAFMFENLFIKADVVEKKGNKLRLIEVKAKGIDPAEESPFYTKRSLKKGPKKLNSEWEPYVLDIAFQTYVASKCFPNLKISSHLCLTNKSAIATVDGINQHFFISKDGAGQSSVKVTKGLTKENLGAELLIFVDVDDEVQIAFETIFEDGLNFLQKVEQLSGIAKKQSFFESEVGSNCKSCEFRIPADKLEKGKKSGFENCWIQSKKVKPADVQTPFVFDVWNFRKAQGLIDEGKILMTDIDEADISPTSGDSGLTASERQWLQIQMEKSGDKKAYLDIDGLRKEMKSWRYPFHFIDFETSMVAIPFNKGRRPYEQMAFQFSHHQVSKDGQIIHKDEYINRNRGTFPNFEFVRALKQSLSSDDGSIFRFATHENTVLVQIREQLLNSKEADRTDLIKFIESITNYESDEHSWEGSRNMIDMCELVKKYYYHPATKGSNSIKKVLPAILNECLFLQDKYQKPTYGTAEMPSLNFKEFIWLIKNSDGSFQDPYKALPPIFQDIDPSELERSNDEAIADGGAAMTAYARMQFSQMSDEEVLLTQKALLKYCELDTLAMVMIYESWNHRVQKKSAKGNAA